MDIAIVWNGRAGSAAGIDVADVRARVAAATGREVEMFEVSDERDPVRCARDALAGGARMVVAAGGDGTVSAVATELIGGHADLGVLPVGTSNSFSAALDIPAALDGAIANLARPDRRIVDAAVCTSEAGRRVMILQCMVGLHAEAIEDTSAAAKRRWGVLAYAATALKRLASLEPFSVEIATLEHHIRCRAIAVGAANIAPLKTVLAHGPSHLLGDDGRVDVTIVAADSIAEAIATGVHLYRTARERAPATRDNVGSFSAATLSITAEPPQRVLVDGEGFGMTPVRVETLPHALRVAAPAAAVAEGDPVEAPLLGLPDLEVDGTRLA